MSDGDESVQSSIAREKPWVKVGGMVEAIMMMSSMLLMRTRLDEILRGQFGEDLNIYKLPIHRVMGFLRILANMCAAHRVLAAVICWILMSATP